VLSTALVLILTAMWAGVSSLAADLPSPAGNVVLHADFETAAAPAAWSGTIRLEPGCRSTGALAVQTDPAGENPTAVISIPLPVEAVRGCLVRGTAMVRAEGVGTPPNPWNGIKYMLALATPDRKLWPQATIGTGTFDWRRVAFTARVPADATSATVVLGLDQVAGRVWFDDVKVVVARPPAARPASPVAGPVPNAPDRPRLRGAMVSPNIDAAGLRVLGRDWNANLIRWQIIRHGRPGEAVSVEGYDAWLEGELKRLDAALPVCEENGLRVVVDLHSPPGGRATVSGYVGSDDRLFTDPACQAKFIAVWQRIATRYRDARPIWGFDLANEPVEDLVEEGCDDWQGLAERAAREIRAIDPRRTIIVEPAAWGGPDGLADLVPLPFSNVVYSVHMYLPHAFTHQGVHGAGPAWRYPGVIDGKLWDKAQLEAALRPVADFERTHGVPIYIGEFSAIRWAPDDSARRYLEDLIAIFEERGWDWSYHAFREWSGWSVEHGSDRATTAPAATPTGRQRLLQRWFAANEKPGR
jgi:hypothetical protein